MSTILSVQDYLHTVHNKKLTITTKNYTALQQLSDFSISQTATD